MVPWRTIFFWVNSAACLGWLIIAVLWVGEESQGSIDPFSAIVGVAMASPAVAIAIGEWLLFSRDKERLERPLGYVAGIVGGLACFGFLANAGEAIVKGGPGTPGLEFWLGFGVICFSIAAYGFWCCWLRVRRKTIPEPRGFPVCDRTAP